MERRHGQWAAGSDKWQSAGGCSDEGAVVGGGGGSDPYSAHLMGEDNLLGHGSLLDR